MKFTLSWLKKHLDTSASLDEILSALTDLGLEVESVENPVEKLEKFTIGKVLVQNSTQMQISCGFAKYKQMKVNFK